MLKSIKSGCGNDDAVKIASAHTIAGKNNLRLFSNLINCIFAMLFSKFSFLTETKTTKIRNLFSKMQRYSKR